ncbi:putative armadillo-like helical protein [Helianthus annuus]|nr:putative armadillo-like helical protein [Helianthus annuus]
MVVLGVKDVGVQEDEKYVKIGMEIDGFVNVLFKFLGVKDGGVQEEALKAVAVICRFEGLESGSELGKELSARCLMKCTAGCDNVLAVSACGGVMVVVGSWLVWRGIRVLVRVVDPKSSYSSKAREKSMRALMVLCSDSVGYMNSLKNYGFMDHILYLLHNGEVSVLDAKSFEAREIAAETLQRLLIVPRSQKRFVQTDQNVNLLLQMIDPEEGNSGNRKVLLSIIMSLTFYHEGGKKILSSGYMKNIEKLAEDQVLDAKKIIRNLSSSRIQSIIRGISHS